MLIPVILCGGVGSRLWPMSREAYPKQFLDLTGSGESMLQGTVARLQGLDHLGQLMVVCNQEHRFMVAEQLQHTDASVGSILLEPVPRNTAPAVAVAAYAALQQDVDATLLVLPADHAIGDKQAFQSAVQKAVIAADKNLMVTFGVIPTHAETGYGYIERGEAVPGTSAFGIARFAEKPDIQTAQQYVDSGSYVWNSGMFVFKAAQLLEEMEAHVPELKAACAEAYQKARTDLDFVRLDAKTFEACPNDSIDYAVMEKTKNGAVVPLDAGWSDVGSWAGLWDIGSKDENGNVFVGDVLLDNSQNCYVHSNSRLVATVGMDDSVVVETADAVLVADKSKVQNVKSIVSTLKLMQRQEGVFQKIVYRPWGSYESICESDRFQVKKIVVNPGQKLSLQKHHHRAEHWIIVKGTARVTCEDNVFTLNEDQSTYIPLGHKHRLENPGKIVLELIEVQSGSYLGEDDIVRYDDVYGRES